MTTANEPSLLDTIVPVLRRDRSSIFVLQNSDAPGSLDLLRLLQEPFSKETPWLMTSEGKVDAYGAIFVLTTGMGALLHGEMSRNTMLETVALEMEVAWKQPSLLARIKPGVVPVLSRDGGVLSS